LTLRTLAGFFAVIAVLVAAIALVNPDHFRGPIARFLSRHSGREIRLDGTLKAHLLSFTPWVSAERVAIGNPAWMPPGPTAEIGRLWLSFELWPLFSHSFVIDRLLLQGAALHLARTSDGRANWQAHDPAKKVGTGPPLIHSLSMLNARVELDDARRHLKFDGTISAEDAPVVAGNPPLRIEGAGNLNAHAASFAIEADSLRTAKRGQPYHFAFDERSSGSHLSGRGSLPRAFDVHALDTAFEAEGKDLQDLYFLTGISLPNTGAYRISGRLARAGMHFQFSDLRASSGQSDMQGTLSIESSSDRARLEGDLHSQLLRLEDLGESAAGRAEPTTAKPLVLSEAVLRIAGIRRDDAVVNFHAAALEAGPLKLHAVAAQVSIDHGVLSVTPLSAAFAQGRITGRIKFDANAAVPVADLDLRILDLGLDQFDRKGQDLPPFDGLLQARFIVKGRGNSLHEIGASANGVVTAVLPHGALRASLAELTGIDLSRALGMMLTKNHKETGVRCGIASFQIHDGTLTGQSLIIDTDTVLITGKGTINLDSEALDIAIRGHPKGLRLLRLRSPLLIRGTLSRPSIGLDARNSAVQAGEAVALGVIVAPLAALLAFVDPGLAKDANCAALIAEAQANGVRVASVATAH